MGRLLNKIKEPNDIKRISPKLYPILAQEIRDFLIDHVSQTGGHLASNLGAVEITMALHICLHFPEDKVVYDVGHQSYVHKLLTGRKDEFTSLRQKDGLCGFPKRCESDCDVFGTGHSSTSISAALGLAVARDLEQKEETIAVVIGDGALSGGMAYEALNNLSILRREKKNMIIILNDNKMSISENVGGMSRYLNDLRSRRSYSEFKENVENALNNIPGVGKSVARTLKKSKDSIKQLFIPGMKEFCDHNKWKIVETYIDEAYSATNDRRPSFQRMITDSEKGLFDIVLVHKLNRFSRNRYDSAYLLLYSTQKRLL